MAEEQENARPPERGAADEPRSTDPITLRHMRVESEYRRETRNLHREERDQYSNWMLNLVKLQRAPKVTIASLVGTRGDVNLGFHHEDPLRDTFDFYRRKDDRSEMLPVLKFYAAYLMQQARKETNFRSQLFLLFKAVDLLRMIVQYSPYSVSPEAESLVFCIFTDLGSQKPERFKNYVQNEGTIYAIVKQLRNMPNDINLRLRLAQELVRQTMVFDALVQYDFLLRVYPKVPVEFDTRRAGVYIRIAELFGELIANTARPLGDGRKLRNFIERYNRDYAEKGEEIPIVTGRDPAQIARAAEVLRLTANRWYERALKVRGMGPRQLLNIVYEVSRNYEHLGRPGDALETLRGNYVHWRKVPVGLDTLQERVKYLDLIAALAVKARERAAMSWANEELREHRGALAKLQTQAAKYQARKEAILRGDEEVGPTELAAQFTAATARKGRGAAKGAPARPGEAPGEEPEAPAAPAERPAPRPAAPARRRGR
ncbi:MAG: hypothetical protein HY423_15485 [Candidatus Lambdaproteobacteria bacterium]|nr:hypothetical protein [Candidatus Lambdaproteobacteria bacterium]